MSEEIKKAIIEVLSEIEYDYFAVSPPKIIAQQKGVLSLGTYGVDSASREQMYAGNLKLIVDYINKASELGWQLVSVMDYEGIPQHGCLIFRRIKGSNKGELTFESSGEYPVETEEEKMERILAKRPRRFREKKELKDSTKEKKSVKKTITLEKRFEQETGKNAIWHEKETEAFKTWKSGFMKRLERGEAITDISVKE